jgi:hypothetical protein
LALGSPRPGSPYQQNLSNNTATARTTNLGANSACDSVLIL